MSGKYSAEHGDDSGYFAAQKNVELRRLGDRVTELEKALELSLHWQSIYANALNSYDGGERITFKTPDEWIARLRKVGHMK